HGVRLTRRFHPGQRPARVSALSLHDALPIYIPGGERRKKTGLFPGLPKREIPRRNPGWISDGVALRIQDHSHLGRELGRGKGLLDRKSTRLNSSHVKISYAVFCLKKKNHTTA